jgi:D-alanyl-D-alanine carboxypeptidase/D-alanyl-D-alanine-endopeptidase (penicillin-binding protein 4)
MRVPPYLLGLLWIAAASAADPVPKPPKPAAAKLAKTLEALIDRSPLAARSLVGVHVASLATGRTLFARNENRLFLPASNMKLATSAVALTRLGPQHTFVTRLLREPSGDLALIGGGDPSLSFRVYPYRKDAPPLDPLHAIEELADQAVAAGLQRVDGDIIGDDRLFPWAPYAPSWSQDDPLTNDGAAVSALSLNDNVIAVTIRGGERPGDPATLELNPPLEYFAIDNRVITAAASPATARVSRPPGSSQLLLWGSVPRGGATTVFAAVDDPALFAAGALYHALARRGIPIRGRPLARHRSVYEDNPAPGGEVLATRTSPPLIELLQVVDKVSQNLHAELILREVGRVAGRTGTREAGLEAAADLLAYAGAPPEDYRLEDGSGLSRNAQITPRSLTRLLAWMYASRHRDAWMSLLPVGGEDGTLSNRLCCTGEAHSIRAKTGSLARAVTLSGYAGSKTHGMLAFSILVNNFAAPAPTVRAWVDRMALALVD